MQSSWEVDALIFVLLSPRAMYKTHKHICAISCHVTAADDEVDPSLLSLY
jgi:hypothetical protein